MREERRKSIRQRYQERLDHFRLIQVPPVFLFLSAFFVCPGATSIFFRRYCNYAQVQTFPVYQYILAVSYHHAVAVFILIVCMGFAGVPAGLVGGPRAC